MMKPVSAAAAAAAKPDRNPVAVYVGYTVHYIADYTVTKTANEGMPNKTILHSATC